MSDLSKQDWADWIQHPVTQAFFRHVDREWGAGGVRFESTLNKFADSREDDRIVLEQIRQVAVCRREILRLQAYPREEIERLRNLEPQPVGLSRRGTL